MANYLGTTTDNNDNNIMMKTKLKFFLVFLAMMVGGVNGAWADNIPIGNSDNTTGYLGAYQEYSLGQNQKLHLEFINYNKVGGDTWNNWVLVVSPISGNDVILRADDWWWMGNTDYNKNNTTGAWWYESYSSNIDWGYFYDDMNGAHVSMDISTVVSGGYVHIIIKVTATNNGRTYNETLKILRSSENYSCTAKLSVDNSHLEITEATTTNCNVSFYDFAGASSLDPRFEGGGGGTGSWSFNQNGYYNGTSGTRQFHIKNLYNGDQVVVSYSGSSASFNTTNAKNSSGEFMTANSTVVSDAPYYVTSDGTLTLNIPRYLTIYSVEITRETNLTPAVSFTSTDTEMTVGEYFQTTVSTTPTKATPVYSSTNPGVATVDAYGRVTAVGAGNTTIKANLTVNGASATEASYNLTVASITTATKDYDFQNFSHLESGNWVVKGEGDYNPSWDVSYFDNDVGITVTVMNFDDWKFTSDNTHGGDKLFGVVSWGWYLSKHSSNSGFFNNTGKTDDFHIKDLHNGDKITITYSNGTCTASSLNMCQYNVGTGKYEDVGLGSAITNNADYIVTSDGYVKIGVSNGTYIEHVRIQREGSPAMTFSPNSTTYELTDLNFTEPTLITQPAGIGVTYSSSDETIAKTGSEDGGPSDIMFIRPGNVTITATAVIGGTPYTASYNILVRADDALFIATSDDTAEFPLNNPYNNKDNVGVVAVNATTFTSVPFITMKFGNGSNIALVRDFSNVNNYHSSMILDADGIQHMSYTPTLESGVTRMRPTAGTYYVFEPVIDGDLTIRGVKRVKSDGTAVNNSVVLVDADLTSGTTTTYRPFSGVTHTVTYAIDNTTKISGTTVAVNDGGTLVANLTFGEARPSGNTDSDHYLDFTTKEANLSGYTYCTDGNNVNGNQRGGTFYTIVPQLDGEIEVAVILNQDKEFYILEDGIAMSEFNGIKKSSKYYGTFTFDVKANKSYKIFCSGSKLGFYGFKFTNDKTYTSYPIVKELEFTGNQAKDDEYQKISLRAGHTYYLYGNNNLTNGSERQVFYLHGFTYSTNFAFANKAVVIGSTGTSASEVTHIAVASGATTVNYQQQVGNHSSGVTYSMRFKGNDGSDIDKNSMINSETGAITGIPLSEPGTYIVTATYSTYKTYYAITVPYTVPSGSTNRITWKFNDASEIESKEELNKNATDWKTYYKVRLYDNQTRALTYINVPVRSNGIGINGDNARYIDKTAGLLFKANAQNFGTTTAEPSGVSTLEAKLTHDPTSLTDNHYVTISNGTSMTIPNLKAGQYVRVKWSRYSENKGDLMAVSNLNDLNNNSINTTFTIGAGGRVSDKGGTGYHEFIVAADGDVTFTLSQDGWANIYEVDVANVFIPTDLRLQTVDATASAGSRGSALAFIHKKDHGDDIVEEYSTAYGRILSQSNTSITYRIKDGTRTGTLNSTNCTIGGDNKTLTVHGGNTSGTTSGHGRFTVVQEGKVRASNGTDYLLDKNEYVIKVYEYGYNQQTYPHTWNMKHVTTDTGNATVSNLTTDAGLTGGDETHNSYWLASNNNKDFTLKIGNPENLMSWNYKSTINQTDGNAIPELDGLGIIPQDLTSSEDNSVTFKAGDGGQGLQIGAKNNTIVVPSVATGQKVYVAATGDGTVKISGAESPLSATRTVSDVKVYEIAGSSSDVELVFNNMTINQVAVSVDTKEITDAGFATEARNYPLDFTLASTFGVNSDISGAIQTAYIITGVDGTNVTKQPVDYAHTGEGVMMGSGVTTDNSNWALFTTDVDRSTSSISENLLKGVTTTGVTVGQTSGSGSDLRYNYILAKGGYNVTMENGTPTAGTTVSGLGYYLLFKSGTVVEGSTYTDQELYPNSAYLQLPSALAVHQGLEGSSSARAVFFIDFDGDQTDIQMPMAGMQEMENDAYYTLQGVRIDNPGKGLYIRNGRKVYVK